MNNNDTNQQQNNFNNMNNYQNPQNQFSQYQNMGYPLYDYPEEKGTKNWHIVVISIVAVLIVALATTLIIVIRNKNMNNMMPPPPPMMNIVPGSVLLNGRVVEFEVVEEEGKTYLPVQEFSKAIGYDCVVDKNSIKIIAPTEISTLKFNSTTVEINDQTVGVKSNVTITTAPFKRDDVAYIYARDIALFLKNAYVTYNAQMDVVEINVGMGGPGMPPQGGQPMPPQGGQPMPPQGGQPMPPQGGQPMPPQGGQPMPPQN